MSAFCPHCQTEIVEADIHLSSHTAYCRKCDNNFSISNLNNKNNVVVKPLQPPTGAWFQDRGKGFEIGVSARKGAPKIFIVALFMLLFLSPTIAGVAKIAADFKVGKPDKITMAAVAFLLWEVFLGLVLLFMITSRIVVRVEEGRATIFEGVGILGRKRSFDWNKVTSIHRTTKRVGSHGFIVDQITIFAEKRINLAADLAENRIVFLLAALQKMHARQN